MFLLVPLVALLGTVPPRAVIAALREGETVAALWLSLRASGLALALTIAVGTLAAYVIATHRFPGRRAVLTAVELPIVLPPAVAGLALLAAFGPKGLFGGALRALGIELPFTFGAVVVASAFVAGPLYVRNAIASFEQVDHRLIEAARSLGASELRAFLRVATPIAMPGLVASGAIAAARALGEFGATLMFAGSLRGSTQTAALAIYELFASDTESALALSVALLALAAALLAAAKFHTARARPARVTEG
ncbi:molybdate ABC transporter permease subunit [Thermoleophilum album]|nr:molybdate ABC transporter permease subunit [Thermoleophilum album]